MTKYFSTALLALLLLLSSCGDNPTTPSGSEKAKWIYYNVSNFSNIGNQVQIEKINIETNEGIKLIDSAAFFSPPVNGQILVRKWDGDSEPLIGIFHLALYTTSGILIKKFDLGSKYTDIGACCLAPDGKTIAVMIRLKEDYNFKMFILKEDGKLVATGIELPEDGLNYNFTPDSKGLICLQNDKRIVYYDIEKSFIELLAHDPINANKPYIFNPFLVLNDKSFIFKDKVTYNSVINGYSLHKFTETGDIKISPDFKSNLALTLNNDGSQLYYCYKDTNSPVNKIYRYDNLKGESVLIDSFVYDFSRMYYNEGNNSLYIYLSESKYIAKLWSIDLKTLKWKRFDKFQLPLFYVWCFER